jgi:hypothetical protein
MSPNEQRQVRGTKPQAIVSGPSTLPDNAAVACRLAELFPESFERFVGNREHARRNGEAERIAIDHHRRPVMWNRNLNLPSC